VGASDDGGHWQRIERRIEQRIERRIERRIEQRIERRIEQRPEQRPGLRPRLHPRERHLCSTVHEAPLMYWRIVLVILMASTPMVLACGSHAATVAAWQRLSSQTTSSTLQRPPTQRTSKTANSTGTLVGRSEGFPSYAGCA